MDSFIGGPLTVDPESWANAAQALLHPYHGKIIAAFALVGWVLFCRLSSAKKVIA